MKKEHIIEEVTKDLQSALKVAQAYKTEDSAMEYAYKYGVLQGAIDRALILLKSK